VVDLSNPWGLLTTHPVHHAPGLKQPGPAGAGRGAPRLLDTDDRSIRHPGGPSPVAQV